MESLLGGVEEERRELDSVEEERRELGGVEEERRELGGVKEERREQGEESFGEGTLKATSDNKLEEEPCEPQGANTTSSTSPNTDVVELCHLGLGVRKREIVRILRESQGVKM